jgi:tetratricopeptide (TPR) repeat protein
MKLGINEELSMKFSVFVVALLLIAGPFVAVADDLDDSFARLKEAEPKKDAAMIKKLAAETSALARATINSTGTVAEEDKEAWAKRVAYAKEVDVYTEYALYSLASGSDAATAIDLLSTLEQQNPKSRYLNDGGYARYFAALAETGASSKIQAIAEKALANLPECEDVLLVMANSALTKGQTAQAVTYAQRLVSKGKRGAATGRGYFIIGIVNAQRNQLFDADRNLRAALPFIRGNPAMEGPALFALGVANYQLGVQTNNKKRVLEAASFSDQASKIPGAHVADAYRNSKAMRDAAVKMR